MKSTNENVCGCDGKSLIELYCEQCKVYVCFNCHVKQHYDHNDKVIDLAEKCCRYLADYQKLYRNIALIADCRETHIRKESVHSILNKLKDKLAGTKRSLKKDTDKSINDTLKSMYKSPIAREMMTIRNEAIKKDATTLTQIKSEVTKMCKILRKCLADSNYESADKLVSQQALKNCEETLGKLSNDANKDIELISELQKLKQTTVNYSYDPMAIMGMIKINTLISKPNRLIQFDQHKNTIIMYNIDTKQLLVTILNSDFILPFRFVTIESNSNIYLSGGDNNYGQCLKSLYFYDEVRGGLVRMEDMQIGRTRHALVEMESKLIYAIGGETEFGATDTCEVYDIKDNIWRTAPKLNEGRCGHAACYAQGKVYAIAGWNKYYLNSIEVLDLKQNTWTYIEFHRKDLNLKELQCSGAALRQSGEIMIFGGYKEGEVLSKETFIIDPKTCKIEKGKDMKEAEAFISSEAKVVNDKIYAFGYTKGGIHEFDESKNEWKYIAYKELLSSLKS